MLLPARAETSLRQGDLTDAAHHETAKLAEIPTPTAMFETRAGVHYTFARAHHHLANNRNHAALTYFLVVGETLAHWQMADIVQWRAGAAEAWLNQGNRAQAKALLNTPRNGHELRLRAACEEKRNRPALLNQAAEDHHTPRAVRDRTQGRRAGRPRPHQPREIADKLFITASTVEQHLTRVYRKLNVKYRTDLPADVAG